MGHIDHRLIPRSCHDVYSNPLYSEKCQNALPPSFEIAAALTGGALSCFAFAILSIGEENYRTSLKFTIAGCVAAAGVAMSILSGKQELETMKCPASSTPYFPSL